MNVLSYRASDEHGLSFELLVDEMPLAKLIEFAGGTIPHWLFRRDTIGLPLADDDGGVIVAVASDENSSAVCHTINNKETITFRDFSQSERCPSFVFSTENYVAVMSSIAEEVKAHVSEVLTGDALKAAFVCATCGIDLTGFLQPVTERCLVLGAGMDLVASGCYTQASSSLTRRQLYGMQFVPKEQGQRVAVHEGDFLVDRFDHHKVANASFGCCGWQPKADEANACCAKGHVIGTIHDDCWTPRVFRLIGKNVELLRVN